MKGRRWLGPFRSLDEAHRGAFDDMIGGSIMYVVDTFDRWFAVPAERIQDFAGYVDNRGRMEPLRDERGPWLA